ncbi:hypothetical protein D918_08132 [Trichuris suis]|nr:hypothetical protein D918_08132 [Trichuris suis]
MGYGSRAVELLQQYYEGAFPALDEVQMDLKPAEVNGQEDGGGSLLEEKIAPRKDLPPLLAKLSERRAERLDWLGVCYGLTPELQKYNALLYLNQVCESAIESHLGIDQRHKITAQELSRPLEEELNEYASEVQQKAQKDLRSLISESDLAKYRIRADEDETEFLSDKLASSKKSKKRLKKMHGGGGGKKRRR